MYKIKNITREHPNMRGSCSIIVNVSKQKIKLRPKREVVISNKAFNSVKKKSTFERDSSKWKDGIVLFAEKIEQSIDIDVAKVKADAVKSQIKADAKAKIDAKAKADASAKTKADADAKVKAQADANAVKAKIDAKAKADADAAKLKLIAEKNKALSFSAYLIAENAKDDQKEVIEVKIEDDPENNAKEIRETAFNELFEKTHGYLNDIIESKELNINKKLNKTDKVNQILDLTNSQ